MVSIIDNEPCVVCDSRYVLYTRHLQPIRLKSKIASYFCMECQSFFNPSGYIPSENELKASVSWHKNVYQNNKAKYQDLLEKLPKCEKIIDIGYGIGTLVHCADQNGILGVGYDLNPWAIEYGVSNFGLDLRAQEWTEQDNEYFDILFCISTLEHIERPRRLIASFANAAKRNDAYIYLHVPIINKSHWHLLFEPEKDNLYFGICGEHVTHFSATGLKTIATQLNATEFRNVNSHKMSGFLFKFS